MPESVSTSDTAKATYIPEVNPHAEFLEICNDFTEPREIVREAISNGFDAGASKIEIAAYIDKTTGRDELVLQFKDNGQGMDTTGLKSFFSLAMTTRMVKDALGFKTSGAIGEKGHGTKIYFNSRRIEVQTVKDGVLVEAVMEEPRARLQQGTMPVVEFSTRTVDLPNGTTISVRGYNDNAQGGFGHNALKDYILWFTKFGSSELLVGRLKFKDMVLTLSGLGWKNPDPDSISFGHPLPEENTNVNSLRHADKVSPLDYYVARWVFQTFRSKESQDRRSTLFFRSKEIKQSGIAILCYTRSGRSGGKASTTSRSGTAYGFARISFRYRERTTGWRNGASGRNTTHSLTAKTSG
jgi:hypothetical protein